MAPCLFGLLAFCFWAATARAQYRFDSWTTERGLPQNSVTDLLQTRDGYLWLATDKGLARFDGVRFTVFNKINTPGIAGIRFSSLCESRDGDLWAGSDGGVIRYRDGVFTTYTTREGLPTNAIRRIDENDVRFLCLECHSNAAGISGQPVGAGDTPNFHDLSQPRWRNCTTCHLMIHGSNNNRAFLR